MAIISISITISEEQIVAGIPKTAALATNIPSTIFFTIDGNDPTLFSDIYTAPIHLPTDKLSVNLKVMATNGTDFSPVISEIYTTNILNDTRLPHSATDVSPSDSVADLYPFGTNPIQPTGTYLNPADAGITTDNPALPATATAFDGEGAPTTFTNQPFDSLNYSIKYSTTDAEGQTGRGIGNLPAGSKIETEVPVPETSEQFTDTFDPRAMVIFQDASKEDPNDPPNINRQFFSLEDHNKVRDGNNLLNAGLDSPPVSGSFVRSAYNARTNEMTYYYFDSIANRWIISKQQFQPNTNGFKSDLSGQVFGRNSSKVYEWIPFTRRVLF